MDKPKTMMIDDILYVRADSVDAPSGDMVLVVLPRGFIYVGQISVEDGWYTLRNASNVRKWTGGGFGGLTLGAKSSGATLDKCCPVKFHESALVSLHLLPGGWLNA